MSAPPRSRSLAFLAPLALALLAPLAAAHAEDVPDIAGIYELNGETTVQGSPDRFVITGKLVLRQSGVDCTAIVEAAMRRSAGVSGPVSAALIGSGEMKIDGRTIAGNAELQSLVSEVPELDVAVPFAPRTAGPILESKTTGKILDDGSLELQITSTLVGQGFTLPEGRKTIVIAKRVARSPTELKKK